MFGHFKRSFETEPPDVTFAVNSGIQPKLDSVRTSHAAFAVKTVTGTTCALIKIKYHVLFVINASVTVTILRYAHWADHYSAFPHFCVYKTNSNKFF